MGSREHQPDVDCIVVGGGLAGLSAADVLNKAGIRFKHVILTFFFQIRKLERLFNQTRLNPPSVLSQNFSKIDEANQTII